MPSLASHFDYQMMANKHSCNYCHTDILLIMIALGSSDVSKYTYVGIGVGVGVLLLSIILVLIFMLVVIRSMLSFKFYCLSRTCSVHVAA